ncbi:hypothetical protein [Jannaschia marina]|nr:hypothetical protein [Jannaschia marina]
MVGSSPTMTSHHGDALLRVMVGLDPTISRPAVATMMRQTA